MRSRITDKIDQKIDQKIDRIFKSILMPLSHSSILGKSHAPFPVGDADDVNYALARLDAGRRTPLWIQLI